MSLIKLPIKRLKKQPNFEESWEVFFKLLLSSSSDIDKKTKTGQTALMIAAGRRYDHGIRSILATGANPNLQNDVQKATPLMYAMNGLFRCRHEWCPSDVAIKNKNITEALLQKGADPNIPDIKGNTPLIIASISKEVHGRADLLRFLLAKGAEPNVCNKHGMTPLMFAAKSIRRCNVEALLQFGADVSSVNNWGSTALLLVTYHNCEELGKTECPSVIRIAKCLIEAGSDVNTKNFFGFTPLMSAARKGHMGLVQYLLSVGADWTLQDEHGDTALLIAAQSGYPNICNILQNLGGNIATDKIRKHQSLLEKSKDNNATMPKNQILPSRESELSDTILSIY